MVCRIMALPGDGTMVLPADTMILIDQQYAHGDNPFSTFSMRPNKAEDANATGFNGSK